MSVGRGKYLFPSEIIMYSPRFTITQNILKNIGAIEAAKAVIDASPLIPLYEKQFREDARVKTIYFGTRIEGNDLSIEQAKKILAFTDLKADIAEIGEQTGIVARERDIQEVINYRQTMDLIDQIGDRDTKTYTETMLKKIHAATINNLVPPEEAGQYRQVQAVWGDQRTGKVYFRPPPAIEVSYLIKDFLDWLNASTSREIHTCLRAAIAHYVLVAIHPFTEANGRSARAFATLILYQEDYDIKKLFSLEEYFDKDIMGYFKALAEVSEQKGPIEDRDLASWLEYFTKALAIELDRVKDKVKKLSRDSHLKSKLGRQIVLSERQVKLYEFLQENQWLTMGDAAKILSFVSTDTILRDLRDLLKKGVVKKTGRTKGAKYTLKT